MAKKEYNFHLLVPLCSQLEGNQAEANRKLLQDRGERRLSQKKIESKDKEVNPIIINLFT